MWLGFSSKLTEIGSTQMSLEMCGWMALRGIVELEAESQVDVERLSRVESVVGPFVSDGSVHDVMGHLETVISTPQHLLGLHVIPARTPSSPLQLQTSPVHPPDAGAARYTKPQDNPYATNHFLCCCSSSRCVHDS